MSQSKNKGKFGEPESKVKKFAVGEQVELKGRKFMVWQLDHIVGSIALVDWDTAVAAKRRLVDAPNHGGRFNPNSRLLKRNSGNDKNGQ